MDINTIRLQNMRSLVGRDGTPTRRALAEAVSMRYELLSNYIGKNPTKNIGNDLARRTEQALGLPHGWMDQTHRDTPHAAEEPTKPYLWPFRAISPKQWDDLADYDRGRVEQLALTLLSEQNARKSAAANGG